MNSQANVSWLDYTSDTSQLPIRSVNLMRGKSSVTPSVTFNTKNMVQ